MATKREWNCKRCNDQINIFVPDNERKFVIDGENIFCGPSCRSAFKNYIPVKIARTKPIKTQLKGKLKKLTKKSEYKCFDCGKIYTEMTWNKMCTQCITNNGDKVLSNEKKSRIRLVCFKGIV